jgi:hypothetical protein
LILMQSFLILQQNAAHNFARSQVTWLNTDWCWCFLVCSNDYRPTYIYCRYRYCMGGSCLFNSRLKLHFNCCVNFAILLIRSYRIKIGTNILYS